MPIFITIDTIHESSNTARGPRVRINLNYVIAISIGTLIRGGAEITVWNITVAFGSAVTTYMTTDLDQELVRYLNNQWDL